MVATWYLWNILDILFIVLIPVEALSITLNFGLLRPLLQNLSLGFLFLYQMNLKVKYKIKPPRQTWSLRYSSYLVEVSGPEEFMLDFAGD